MSLRDIKLRGKSEYAQHGYLQVQKMVRCQDGKAIWSYRSRMACENTSRRYDHKLKTMQGLQPMFLG